MEVRSITEQNTLQAINNAAKKEFIEKGFQSASLRNIVKMANVTTGAFYGYYPSKEALFDALAGVHADYILSLHKKGIKEFECVSDEKQMDECFDVSKNCMEKIMKYVFEHREAFKLVLECAEGTKYSNFIHNMVVCEVESTCHYVEILRKKGNKIEHLNENFIHMIASGLFSGMFETIVHDMCEKEAKEYISQLWRFYSAGWAEILGTR